MADNFHFVPRSVSHKPSKTGKISRRKPRVGQTTSTEVRGTSLSPLGSNGIENLRKTEEETLENNSGSFASLVGEGHRDEYDGDSTDIVYFSKNQRWPVEGEPICVVCGRYGEFICDETDADVCSKECKAKNLHSTDSRRSAQKQEGESSPAVDSSDERSKTEQISAKTIAAKCQEERTLGNISLASQETGIYKYTVHPQIASLTEDQVNDLRSCMEISIKGDNVERPVMEFAHCNLSEQLCENLKASGYVTPTPVQMQVLPVALAGRDLLVCAQTGSGKTAAFLVPMITRIYYYIASKQSYSRNSPMVPQGLVLAPTRELCMQIETQAKELVSGLAHMKTALVVGGMPMPNQIYRLQQGVQIVVATPGRLAEILSKADLDFSEAQMLIVDEVDVLMQMGFENQVQSILEKLPSVRQTLLFSATIPPSVERISSNLLSNSLWISVGAPSAPNMDVKQVILWVEDRSKKKRLFALLNDSKYFTPPILVFVDSRLGADMLSEAIQETCNVRCTSMHGDKVQNERTRILQAFLAGEYDVLVCTGVLGRGLDLRCVKQVINFDMPSNVNEYIHQIGRAGRLGSKGLAITFINNTNKAVFLDLVEALQPHGVKLPDELVNSPHLSSQQYQREHQRKSRKRKQEESYVNRENLMDILKKSTFRRRLKDR